MAAFFAVRNKPLHRRHRRQAEGARGLAEPEWRGGRPARRADGHALRPLPARYPGAGPRHLGPHLPRPGAEAGRAAGLRLGRARLRRAAGEGRGGGRLPGRAGRGQPRPRPAGRAGHRRDRRPEELRTGASGGPRDGQAGQAFPAPRRGHAEGGANRPLIPAHGLVPPGSHTVILPRPGRGALPRLPPQLPPVVCGPQVGIAPRPPAAGLPLAGARHEDMHAPAGPGDGEDQGTSLLAARAWPHCDRGFLPTHLPV